MAIPKGRSMVDHDFPAAKKLKTNISFTLKDFMEDLPRDEPIISEYDSPLPSTVLSEEEMQPGTQTKPTLRSTFNIELPPKLVEHDRASTRNAPFRWMKNQYAHCIIPELGEEYDFGFDSHTFHILRDLHNARVRIRDGGFLPDDMIFSLASRWISLEEQDRPASDGYLANDETFVTTCLPLSDDENQLEKYFESKFLVEPSARYYIPRSKYSIHFVGEPKPKGATDIQYVMVGSVLIRNSGTGDVVYIDTGALATRKDRARTAGHVLKSWLEFQKTKFPKASLGPVSSAEPLMLDVDKETHPTLRSLHALVSASLFLRRGITNWGQVKAFKARNAPNSVAMANYALQNISGWLGIKSTAKKGEQRPRNPTKSSNTFRDNYDRGALFGREHPAPVSERIKLAQKGELPVYNEVTELGDNVSDHGDSSSGSSSESGSDRSKDSADNHQDAIVANRRITSEVALNDDESSSDESSEESSEESSDEEPNHEVVNKQESAKKKPVSWKEPVHEGSNSTEPNSTEPNITEPNSTEPNSKESVSRESSSKESNDQDIKGDDANHDNLKGEKSGNDVDGQTSAASA